MSKESPTVLFVCVQNAGRSQIAETLFNRLTGDPASARSAGTTPAMEIHPNVVASLGEIDIDVSGARPKALTAEITDGVGVVVTMGCGDECPVIPGARVVDWDIPDPAGLGIDAVREIRDEIARRVTELLSEIA